MTKRARYETDKGLVTLSRGVLSVKNENGETTRATPRLFLPLVSSICEILDPEGFAAASPEERVAIKKAVVMRLEELRGHRDGKLKRATEKLADGRLEELAEDLEIE